MSENSLDFLQKADSAITRIGDSSIFNLTPKEFVSILDASVYRVIKATQPIISERALLTRKDVMERFNISYPTLLTHERKGLIQGRKVGHKFFYTEDDLDQYMRNIPKPASCEV